MIDTQGFHFRRGNFLQGRPSSRWTSYGWKGDAIMLFEIRMRYIQLHLYIPTLMFANVFFPYVKRWEKFC